MLNSDVIDICTGLKLGPLFLRNMEHVIGSNLPYQETGDAQDKALAATNLGGGILVKHVTGANHVARWQLCSYLMWALHMIPTLTVRQNCLFDAKHCV